MTPELINPNQLAKAFGIHSDHALKVLQAAKLEPLFMTPKGRGTMRLFSRIAAEAVMRKHIESTKPAPEPVVEEATLGAIGAAVAELSEQFKGIASELRNVSLDAMELESVRQDVVRCHDQNVLLFRLLTETRAEMTASFESLRLMLLRQAGETVRLVPEVIVPQVGELPKSVAEVAQVVVQAEQKIEEASKAKLRKVALVGLRSDQMAAIQREFQECFEIRFFTIEAARGRAYEDTVARCDDLVCMTKVYNRGIDELARKTGVRLIRVSGSVSMLRDRLTSIFCEGKPSKAA